MVEKCGLESFYGRTDGDGQQPRGARRYQSESRGAAGDARRWAAIGMNRQDHQRLLGFSEQWLRLGLLTEDELRALGQEYDVSDDKSTEHYRYRVFVKFLASHRPLSPQVAAALYELGRDDPHPPMGGAMMHDIVNLAECPAEVLEKASASGENHLVRAVRRRRLLEELNAGLTEELFTSCLVGRDSVLQRALLERQKLSRGQLEQLAAGGSNRAVRNMARERLRGRRDAA